MLLPPYDPSYFQSQVFQRLDKLDQKIDHRFDQMETRWDTLFGPSNTFYAAYGPQAGQPSSSAAPPQDEDEEDDDD